MAARSPRLHGCHSGEWEAGSRARAETETCAVGPGSLVKELATCLRTEIIQRIARAIKWGWQGQKRDFFEHGETLNLFCLL